MFIARQPRAGDRGQREHDLNDRPRGGTVTATRSLTLTVCLTLGLSALPGVSNAGYIDSPVCQAHLDKIEGKLSTISISSVPAAAESGSASCEAMHGQVRLMLAARNFYKRCATGVERVQRLGFAEGSITQIAARISQDCTAN